jgi:cell division protein FtsB
MKSLAAFGLCIVLFSTFGGDRGLPALVKARRDAGTLSAEISALRAENARLRIRAEALRSDRATIEAVARDTLGFARADEIVVTRQR